MAATSSTIIKNTKIGANDKAEINMLEARVVKINNVFKT